MSGKGFIQGWKDEYKKLHQKLEQDKDRKIAKLEQKLEKTEEEAKLLREDKHEEFLTTKNRLVKTLQQKLGVAREAIELTRRMGCWCEVGIGSLGYKEHTENCKKITQVLEEIDGKDFNKTHQS